MENNHILTNRMERLQQALDQMTRGKKEGLLRLKDIQSFGRVLLQKEVRRLQRKLGPEHPRVKALHASLVNNQEVHQHLKSKLHGEGVKATEVSGDDTLFHGRVFDESGQGVLGTKVQFTDEQGEKLAIVDADTDKKGYFSVTIKPEMMAQIKDKMVHFCVVTPDGKLLYEHPEAFTMEVKKHKLVNVVVERSKAYPFSPKERMKATKAPKSRVHDAGVTETSRSKVMKKQKTARYLGNTNKMELHDLNCQTEQCQVDKIKADHRINFKTQKEALAAGYDYCDYCFSRNKSK